MPILRDPETSFPGENDWDHKQTPAYQKENDEFMNQVENRLVVLNAWKSILEANLFGDTEEEAYLVVEDEIRDFARAKMEQLLGGLGPTPISQVSSQFTPEEVKTLKALAGLSENELSALKGLAQKVLTPRPTVAPISVVSKPEVELVKPEPKVLTPSVVQSAPRRRGRPAKAPEEPKKPTKTVTLVVNGKDVTHELDLTTQAKPPGYKKPSQEEMNAQIEAATIGGSGAGSLSPLIQQYTGGRILDE